MYSAINSFKSTHINLYLQQRNLQKLYKKLQTKHIKLKLGIFFLQTQFKKYSHIIFFLEIVTAFFLVLITNL